MRSLMSDCQFMSRSIGIPISDVNRQTGCSIHQNSDMSSRIESFGDRLRLARSNAGLTQKQLAKKAGISQSRLSEVENGDGRGSSYTPALAEALAVPAIWLASGKGEPPKWLARDSDHENAADVSLSAYSYGVTTQSQSVSTDVDLVAINRDGQVTAVLEVKVFDARASMGLGVPRPETDTVVDHMRLTQQWVKTHLPSISSPDNLAVLSAYGDSMSPTFADGDILMVDRGITEIRLDAVYVLSLRGELYIKRIQRRITDGAVIIKSDNPLYDPVVVENGERDGLEVLGRVVWAWNGRKM